MRRRLLAAVLACHGTIGAVAGRSFAAPAAYADGTSNGGSSD